MSSEKTPKELKLEISKRLHILRDELDPNTNKFADRIKLDQGVIKVWFLKKTETFETAELITPSVLSLGNLFKYTNVNPLWLFCGEGKMFNEGGEQTVPDESGLSLSDRYNELFKSYKAIDKLSQDNFTETARAHQRIDSISKKDSADDVE